MRLGIFQFDLLSDYWSIGYRIDVSIFSTRHYSKVDTSSRFGTLEMTFIIVYCYSCEKITQQAD